MRSKNGLPPKIGVLLDWLDKESGQLRGQLIPASERPGRKGEGHLTGIKGAVGTYSMLLHVTAPDVFYKMEENVDTRFPVPPLPAHPPANRRRLISPPPSSVLPVKCTSGQF